VPASFGKQRNKYEYANNALKMLACAPECARDRAGVAEKVDP
jgi:hypothetical protein